MGVNVRERPKGSGVYWVFINHRGKRKAKKVGTKRDAEVLSTTIRRELCKASFNLSNHVESQVPLFRDYAQNWLAGYVQHNCKYSTQISYCGHLKNYLLPAFGHKRLNEISRKDVKKFLYTRLDSDLRSATVKRLKSTLSSILTNACDDELITINAAANLGRFFRCRNDAHTINPLTEQEIIVMLKTAREYFADCYPVLLLAVSTGMRLGEIVALEPGDIDFEDMFIEVRRSLVLGRMETPKNGKTRRVDLSSVLANVLKTHIAQTKAKTLQKGWRKVPPTLFYNHNGGPLDKSHLVKRSFHKCLEKSGLRKVRFHDLRHSFASLHIQHGESLAWVRDQLGHHSIKLTVDTYGHLVPGANQQAADRLLGTQLSATQAQPECCQA